MEALFPKRSKHTWWEPQVLLRKGKEWPATAQGESPAVRLAVRELADVQHGLRLPSQLWGHHSCKKQALKLQSTVSLWTSPSVQEEDKCVLSHNAGHKASSTHPTIDFHGSKHKAIPHSSQRIQVYSPFHMYFCSVEYCCKGEVKVCARQTLSANDEWNTYGPIPHWPLPLVQTSSKKS